MYENNGTKQAKAHYNYFIVLKKKKKKGIKTTVGEDVATMFYQKMYTGFKEVRHAATPELAIKPKTEQMSVQTEELHVNISVAFEVSITETSQESALSTPGTPSRRKTADSNI